MSKSTEITAMKNSPYGVADWRSGISSLPIPQVQRKEDVAKFYNNLWPASEAYTSSLNPIFLLDLPNMEELPKGPMLVRDGLLPVLWFFKKNPSPGAFEGVLQIHADFEEFVPDQWRKQVELYRFFSAESGGYLQKPKKSAPARELLLLGLVAPSVCSLPALEKDLQGIVRAVGGKPGLEKCRIKAVLPFRFEDMGLFNGHSYYNRFMVKICQQLGTEIDFLEYEAYRSSYPAEGTWYHEFNERWLYADSYLSLLAQSKACHTLPLHKAEAAEHYDRVLPAFPHVSCGIRKEFKKSFVNYVDGNWISESEERAKRYYTAMNTSANTTYPWPDWFSSWCGEFTKRA